MTRLNHDDQNKILSMTSLAVPLKGVESLTIALLRTFREVDVCPVAGARQIANIAGYTNALRPPCSSRTREHIIFDALLIKAYKSCVQTACEQGRTDECIEISRDVASSAFIETSMSKAVSTLWENLVTRSYIEQEKKEMAQRLVVAADAFNDGWTNKSFCRVVTQMMAKTGITPETKHSIKAHFPMISRGGKKTPPPLTR